MGNSPRGRRTAPLVIARVLVLCALASLLLGGTARADGVSSGADVQVAQTLGTRDLTIILRRMDIAPGPLHVDVVTHTGSAPGTLKLRASTAGTTFSETTVRLDGLPGAHSARLQVDQPGPWELGLDDGTDTASIPFIVPARVIPPWEKATFGGFVAAGVFLVLGLVVAMRVRRPQLALIPAGGMVAALAVAITGAMLSASTPPPPAPGAALDPTIDNIQDPYANAQMSTVDFSRPPVNLAVRSANARSGALAELRLAIADGATGRPVDDLLVHDNALVHLVVISPTGRLWHLHPVRVGPGDYRVKFTPPEAGTYAVAAELARRGGGVQLVRSTLAVATGTDSPAEPVPAGAGKRVVNGNPVDIDVRPGTPTTITARFTRADLQPWLGMLGHLIVVGPITDDSRVGAAAAAAPTWAHVHSMIPQSPGMPGKPDETVAAYGPDVPFTYTFAAPGKYRIWLQAEREYTVLTVPMQIEVPAEGAPQ
ncbi:hypothetical protein DMH03_01815 [Amycolatopsis sp. WAC 01376]|uniref:hypothetical protein n=1 Tax=Amycolatopsis sp. WAC 01376 TaxID=2203195 RepID=UPI000F7BAC89|nr:hypothetical protein [Amycolatopsis sp. WAC 01376]RSM65904.1 hypothetical protein DMH03_01815 [Amycolatopsis sp. WAC 01376]